MRILMLNWRCPTNPKSGGAEYVTRKHLEAWTLAGHEIHWLAGGYPGAKPYEKLDISPKTREQCKAVIPDSDPGSISPLSSFDLRPSTSTQFIHLHRFGTPLSITFLAPLLYWFKWHGDFDLVIDQIHGIPFLTPLWAWKSRKIAFIHEVAQEIWDEMLAFPINIMGKIYEKVYFLFYKNIYFWTVSNSTKSDLIRFGIRKEYIIVIPNAIDLEPIKEAPIKEDVLTLVFLGRLVKMKGIEDALCIIAEVKKTAPEVRLWVVGGGGPSYISHLQDMTKELGIEANVEFKGRVSEDEKVRLFRRAHWLLHTSVREGFGLTVLEANSQGTPILCYPVSGLSELVEDGVNGVFLHHNQAPTLPSQDSQTFKTMCDKSIARASYYRWDNKLKQSLSLILKIYP